MATIRDLIPRAQLPGEQNQPQALWYATVLAPLPVLLSDPLWVNIPDIDASQSFGPCRWPTGIVPAVGQDALVVFDNRGQIWVISLW